MRNEIAFTQEEIIQNMQKMQAEAMAQQAQYIATAIQNNQGNPNFPGNQTIMPNNNAETTMPFQSSGVVPTQI